MTLKPQSDQGLCRLGHFFSACSPLRRMISRVISAAAYMSFTSSHSLTVWMARIPVPKLAHSIPFLLKMFAAEPHRGDAFGGDLDGGDSLLGGDAGVGFEPVDFELEVVGRGALGEEEAGVVGVEDQPVARAQARGVYVLGAEQADLLADGEDGVDRRVRDVLLLQAADRLDDDGYPRLVVAAEHGRAVGADDVPLDDGLDTSAGDDRVHVGAHHDGLGVGDRAREARDDVAGVAADLLPGVVDLDLRAQLLADPFDALGDLALLARDRVYPDEFEQKVFDALLINHLPSAAGDG